MLDRLVALINEAKDEYPTIPSVNCCKPTFAYYLANRLLAGGVVLPPCKVGDTVYTNLSMQGWYYRIKDRPYTARIVFIGVNDSEETGCGYINVLFEKNHNMMQFRLSDIGKTVFLTREEAEQALLKP